ncbi:MBL fold metallo-hydrolase [Sphingomonas sp. 2R-10]|uniref:MBL fold metallo-hydrolase n=1 Tax=Sphingomonas sp. 2R-10 TaxID=3045148 RepID=UPI000F7A337B|nr:MBL fold metallo-hydrolase [Sphingomonas sp. 2R-10]MDJ0277223.1 MBL fold metallo-hydrolase [Sphingomonas sp. 2R-10]
MGRVIHIVGWGLVWIVAALCLAVTIAPRFLDRIYYRGVAGDHFDGARFFNPDGDDTSVPPGGSRRGYFWRQATGSDGRPAWPARVPVAAAKPAELLAPATLRPRDPARTPMRVTWVGHASVLVQVPGLNILTDPVWSDRAGPFGFGPKRVADPGIALADLPKIDLILISHNHYDHLDLSTLRRLWDRDRPAIVTAHGNDAILRSAGMTATALDWRQAERIGGATVHVVRNHHWSSRWFVDRNRALWSAFVVELPGGNLFFAGDTGMGDGAWVREAAALGPIRLALIPIGAFRFQPGQMASGAHIGPVDALDVFRRLGASRGMAIHWGTFRLSYEGWATPPKLLTAARRCAGQGDRRFGAVAIGRPIDIAPFTAPPPPAFDRAAILRCLDTPAGNALR